MKFDQTPAHWKLVSLNDLGEVNRGRSRHRPRDAAHLYGGPYPFVQTGDVKASGGRITEYTQSYNEEGLRQSRLWPAETMCITIAANIAETGVLRFPACFPDSVIGFIADKNVCDVYYVEYMFRLLRRGLQHEASGSVQDNINLATLERLRFPIPPLVEQKKIVSILGSLDDKIEINRAINRTLEAMAQAIFKSWFVDFDPVKAKMAARESGADPTRAAMAAISGKNDAELDAFRQEDPKSYQRLHDTAQAFPDALVESELGLIPEGWQYESAESVATVGIGKTPPRKESEWFSVSPKDVKWVSIRDMGTSGTYMLDTSEYLTDAAVDKFNVRRIPDNSVLLSFKLTVGRVAITVGEMLSNEAIAHFVPKARSGLTTEYLYHYLKQFDYETLGSTSSIARAVNSKTIKGMPILVPDGVVVGVFQDMTSGLMATIRSRQFEANSLSGLRDMLLPRLLSGELGTVCGERDVL